MVNDLDLSNPSLKNNGMDFISMLLKRPESVMNLFHLERKVKVPTEQAVKKKEKVKYTEQVRP